MSGHFIFKGGKMNKITAILVTILIAFALVPVQAGTKRNKRKADKQTVVWRYGIEVVRTGTQGTYLVKAWSYSKERAVAIEQSKKNAVHGIIFKGFAGKSGIAGKSPLVTNPTLTPEQEKFFDNFFVNGGAYMKFVETSNDGAIGAGPTRCQFAQGGSGKPSL